MVHLLAGVLYALVVVGCRTAASTLLPSFGGIPESVLASGKFPQGMKGPFFLVGLNCANQQESPKDL